MYTLTAQNYRSFPAISNSDLTEFERFLIGEPNKIPVKAFAEGSAFHQLLLEPRCERLLDSSINQEQLCLMAQAVRRSRFGKWVLQWGQKEQPHLFRDAATGLLCKCQTDLRLRHGLIVDIKTTRARTHQQFIQCCEQYQYDRQAAFYLDGLNAKRFVLLGVQKAEPFEVFYYEPTADAFGRAFVQAGRDRYRRLLSLWAKSDFTPSSWIQQEQRTKPKPKHRLFEPLMPNYQPSFHIA